MSNAGITLMSQVRLTFAKDELMLFRGFYVNLKDPWDKNHERTHGMRIMKKKEFS